MRLAHKDHETFLESVSEQMIRHPLSQKFMSWVCRYLLHHMGAGHVSIALYDHKTKTISIEFSEGRHRIPTKLISLDPESALLQWFESQNASYYRVKRSHKLVCKQRLIVNPDPQSAEMMEDLMRHHTEVCVKIETHNQLAGYLLVGPRASGKNYSREDIVFFQILANDIAIEIEKEQYYCSSQYDPLTGLLNRNSLAHTLQVLMERTRENHTELALALLDLDNFKSVNDLYGHLVGDGVLHIAAEWVRDNVRKTDLTYRYGGEEFLLLLPMSSRNPLKQITSEEFRVGIRAVMERICQSIGTRPVHCLEHQIGVTFSIGVSFFRWDDLKTAEDLIREADEALYHSKDHGKNQVTVFGAGAVYEP